MTDGFGRGSLMAVWGGVVLVAMAGCNRQSPVDTKGAESALRAADAQWSRTAEANDLEGTVSFYGDGAVLLAPNEPIATDKKAIRAAWAGMLGPGVALSWQVSRAEVAQSGELGYVYGSYRLIAKDAHGNPANDQGKFVEVWKRRPDGVWKCVVDTYNSDLPVPAPVAPSKSHK